MMAPLMISSCTKSDASLRVFKKSKALMHTKVTINVAARSPEEAEDAIDEAFDAIESFEKKISFWDPESEISAINRNAGIAPVKVSPETLDIIEKALYVSEKTNGAFDATIGPIIRLWDFKNKTVPDKADIEEKLGLVDYREMTIDKEASTAYLRKKGMSFDTGGIAKGYGADIAVESLKSRGITAGLVAISGDIRAFGEKPGGKPWRVGIRKPRPTSREDRILAEIDLVNAAVSTSGDYERFFIKDGRRYHHLINPRDGMPATGAQSVSVITKEAVYTDGFSTGIFVLGPVEGTKALVDAGLDGIIIDNDGNIHILESEADSLNFGLHKKSP